MSREIHRLAIPSILAGIAEPIIGLVDTAFIGRVGTVELAAVGIAGSFYLMLVWIFAQTLTAIAAIAGRHYGRRTLNDMADLVPQALLANVLLGVGLYAVTVSFAPTIFTWYKADGAVLEACVEYFSIRAIGFPLTLSTLLLFGLFRGLQNTSWAMGISLGAMTINLVLDYLLIFGWGSIPALGLAGAAYAGLAAQAFMFVTAWVILRTKTPFRLRLNRRIHPEFAQLAGMSGNLFVRTLLLNFAFYLATRYATGYGKSQVAAHTILINIWLFSSFFIDGYAHAGNALAGRYLGENSIHRLYATGRRIAKYTQIIGWSLGLVYFLAYPWTAAVFTTDPNVASEFNAVYFLVIITQPINAVAFAYDGIYKGLGEMRVLRNLLLVATLVGFVPVVVTFHYVSPGLFGIWVGFLVWMSIRAGWLHFDFRRRFASSARGENRPIS